LVAQNGFASENLEFQKLYGHSGSYRFIEKLHTAT
jgi:hypothetical protein